ncbi:alpha/beta fold hydrolase [Dysosmobacter sp.]
MNRQEFETDSGTIVYWISELKGGNLTLVFLPGLTATHHLFEKQIAYFEDMYNCMVWDAPAHGESRPFTLDFDLRDKARWLHEIFEKENITKPILVGQSMGGYVSQMYMEMYPGECGGFVSIDSCSLKRKYVTAFDIWALKRTEPMYRMFPWEYLKKIGAKGCAETEYGQKLMRQMLDAWDKDSYCKVSGHGFKMLAEALESNKKYKIDCPVVLICGTKDQAGSAKRYDKKWQKGENLQLIWIEGAGHNSNTDKPEEINRIIEDVVNKAIF